MPKIPDIPGHELFEGQILHSIDYRHPEMFKGKKVLVIGISSSGLDVVFDLAPFTEKLCMGIADMPLMAPFGVKPKVWI